MSAGRLPDTSAPAFDWPPPPDSATLERFLDEHAPLLTVPLCPELRAFSAASLVTVWEAAEASAGTTLPSPFWAFPWPAGITLARVILDRPELVRDRSVIDMGAGGGVSSFACAMAGASHVTACDADPWAVEVAALGARRQGLALSTLLADPAARPALLDPYDVILCGDLAYDRSSAPRERYALDRAASRGATVLVADAGRTYFQPDGYELIAELRVPVVKDLEGATERLTRVYVRRTPSAL